MEALIILAFVLTAGVFFVIISRLQRGGEKHKHDEHCGHNHNDSNMAAGGVAGMFSSPDNQSSDASTHHHDASCHHHHHDAGCSHGHSDGGGSSGSDGGGHH
jgi:hypothetical protein